MEVEQLLSTFVPTRSGGINEHGSKLMMREIYMQFYEGDGIRFEYPHGWKLIRDEGDLQVAVTVNGPGAAFWMVSVLKDRPPAEDLIEMSVDLLRSEYPTCDDYASDAQICLLPTVARDVEFMTIDLVNTARLRACEADDVSILVLYQLCDRDAEEVEEMLEAMTRSLMWDGDDLDDEIREFDPFRFDNLFRDHDKNSHDSDQNDR